MEKTTGRKYKITLISTALATLGFVASGFFPPLQEVFGEFVMGLSGLLGIYCGGNVGNKFVASKRSATDGVYSDGRE